MNKLLAYLIDSYALYDLHKKRSNKFHYYKGISTPPAVSDLHTFYTVPETPGIIFEFQSQNEGYNIGKYKYESSIRDNDDSNRYSTGTCYVNANNRQQVSAILVHGWRMNSFSRIDNIYLKPFMDLGYDIYHFTLPHHFERTPAISLYNGELMVSANIDRTLLSVKQAISDLRALISFIKEIRNQKVILVGISLGGFITNLASVIEEKIDILISVMYANSIAFSVFKSIPGKYMKGDFETHGFTYEELKEYWAITEPSNFKPVVKKENILLISGRYDRYVLGQDTDLLWDAWDKPKRLLYPSGHAGIVLYRDRIAKDSMKFISSIM